MPQYTALFDITLPATIRTTDAMLPALRARVMKSPFIADARITPGGAHNLLTHFACELVCVGEDLHQAQSSESIADGVLVLSRSGALTPAIIALPAVLRTLYEVSAMTLQWEAYSPRLREELEQFVVNERWILPTGEEVRCIPGGYPAFMLYDIPDPSRRDLEFNDWATIQSVLDGEHQGAPLWRTVLADAHRERERDIRNATLKCATALDVGVQPFVDRLQDNKASPIDLIRGAKGSRTPDLRASDTPLHDDIARLWYTRHRLIHHGKAEVFTISPRNKTARAEGPLTKEHVERFLCAVPRVIAYVEANPP